jgi:membrane fusion protein (multidrug efflux system)
MIVIALLVVLFGSIGGYLYQRFSAFASMDFTPPPVTIAASIATKEIWQQSLSAVGTIRSVNGIDLTSETSGVITSIQFDSGKTVARGELLVVLNDEIERASRQNQIASLGLAQILFDRDRALIEQKSIPQTQYDRSLADLERAKAQLAETDARLSNKQINAPFSGTLGIRRVDVGEYVTPGTVIATLQDSSRLEIDFTVPARYSPRLKAGLDIDVSVDAFPDRQFKAVVTAVDSKVDTGTRNVLLRAKLENADGLVAGMFAVLKVDLGIALDVVTVPETAMTYALQGNTIYVIDTQEDGSLSAVARVVEAGTVRDGKVAVLTGLSPGEQVVSVGQNKLYRGVKVVIDEAVVL